MVSYNALKVNTLLFVFCALFVLGTQTVNADYTEWNDSFETYSTGDLNGQGNWTGDTAIDVVSGCYSGQCLQHESISNDDIYKTGLYDLINYEKYQITAWFSIDDANVNNGSLLIIPEDSNTDGFCGFGSARAGTPGYQMTLQVGNEDDWYYSNVPEDTWFDLNLVVDNVNGECYMWSSTLATTSPIDYFTVPTSTTRIRVSSLSTEPGASKYRIDSISVNLLGDVIIDPNQCTTCTRVISHSPDENEDLEYPSAFPLQIDYYVSPDDFVSYDGDTGTKVSYSYRHVLSDYQTADLGLTQNAETIGHSVIQSGTSTMLNLLEETTVVGSYYATIEIYNVVDNNPWWQFWNNTYNRVTLYTKNYSFYIATTTTLEDIQEAEQQAQEARDAGTNTGSDSYWSQQLKQMVDDVLQAPPIGYATLIIDMFNSTTSTTTTMELALVGATGTPLFGHTISLDLSGAIDEGITFINSEQHQMYDKFMTWWNIIWYMALAFWIIREIMGSGIGFEQYTEETPNTSYKKSGVIHSGARYKKRSGTSNAFSTKDINMKRDRHH